MSIRTNPMKAVPVLLKRVKTARTKFHETGRDEWFDGKLDKLTHELNKIEDVFIKVKKNQDALLDTLHEIDAHLRNLDRTRLDQDMDAICKRIRYCARKLLPMDSFDDDSSDDVSSEIVHSSHPSSTQPNNQVLLPQPQGINILNLSTLTSLDICLMCLAIFPEHAVIKKRQAIYLWIGKGLIVSTEEKTAEEEGEDVIDKLSKLKVIVPYGNGRCSTFNKFKLNPHIRPQIESFVTRGNAERLGFYLFLRYGLALFQPSLVLEQQKVTLGDVAGFTQAVYNISASYLNFGSKWMDSMKFLNMLQLGRWQDSPSHHIEVGSQEFLKDLRHHKHLTYLSLRGISRIFELPPSIAQIQSLEILDLKACHNLETLPDDISSMTNLTHLILSQCYLLDGMPEGIEKLTKLQVLKGFIIGSSRKTPCRISDLANLKKLRRLSIRIRAEAVINDGEFHSLGELSALEHLNISWGVSDTRFSDIHIIFPSSLKKLHLECFPEQEIPEWLKPSKLPRELQFPHTSRESQQFKELKLTGGNLKSMNLDDDMNKWSMEIVRLKYLRHLEVDISTLQKLFPLLRYAEIRKTSNHSHFEWSID